MWKLGRLHLTAYAFPGCPPMPSVTSHLEGCHHQRVTHSPETKDKSDRRFLRNVLD